MLEFLALGIFDNKYSLIELGLEICNDNIKLTQSDKQFMDEFAVVKKDVMERVEIFAQNTNGANERFIKTVVDDISIPQEEKDETKLEKILTLNKKENGVKEKVAEVTIDIDGVAKITYPERYNRADILEYIKHANSSCRQQKNVALKYDENYAKDGRDDYTAIFSMALNAIVSKNCVVPDVLYYPKPINTLDGESIVENGTTTKNN